MSAKGAAGGDDGADEVAGVEERGQDGSFLWVGQFTNQTRTGDNGVWETKTDDGAGNDVHGSWMLLVDRMKELWLARSVHTVLRETLNNGANDHDPGAKHDAPSPTKRIVDQGNEGQSEDRAERKS